MFWGLGWWEGWDKILNSMVFGLGYGWLYKGLLLLSIKDDMDRVVLIEYIIRKYNINFSRKYEYYR